jgi:hypothetical protein
LVGLVVIDVEFDRKDHGSVARNCDQEGAGTMPELTTELD